MDTTKEKNEKRMPNEVCGCDTAAEQAPVTQEELHAAIDRLLIWSAVTKAELSSLPLLKEVIKPDVYSERRMMCLHLKI